MRRIAAMAVTVAVPIAMMATLLAGCGSSSPSTDVKVTGAFGKNPAVHIPQAKPDSQLVVKTVVKGSGPQLGQSDAFVGNYVGLRVERCEIHPEGRHLHAVDAVAIPSRARSCSRA